MFREAEAILAALGVALDVRSPARGLTLAAQQSVEIAKAISLNVRVLIMDEPTASLSAHEVAQLFKLVRDLRAQGVAILFVSHRIEEVFEIADKVTVFRDGRLISTRPRAEATPRECDRRHGRARDGPAAAAPAGAAGRASAVGARAGARRRLRGRQLRPASRRGAGLRRPDRRRPHRCRRSPSSASRRRPRARSTLDGKPITVAIAARRRWRSASPMSRRTAASSACRCRCRSRPTSRCRCCARYLNRFGLIRTREERATAEAFRKRLAIRTPSVDLAGRQALRRQPAEGDAEQMAEHAARRC